MQKVHNILITYNATQISETLANVYEFLKLFEVSPRKLKKKKKSKLKYIYQ